MQDYKVLYQQHWGKSGITKFSKLKKLTPKLNLDLLPTPDTNVDNKNLRIISLQEKQQWLAEIIELLKALYINSSTIQQLVSSIYLLVVSCTFPK